MNRLEPLDERYRDNMNSINMNIDSPFKRYIANNEVFNNSESSDLHNSDKIINVIPDIGNFIEEDRGEINSLVENLNAKNDQYKDNEDTESTEEILSILSNRSRPSIICVRNSSDSLSICRPSKIIMTGRVLKSDTNLPRVNHLQTIPERVVNPFYKNFLETQSV